MAPAINQPVLQIHHFSRYSKWAIKKLQLLLQNRMQPKRSVCSRAENSTIQKQSGKNSNTKAQKPYRKVLSARSLLLPCTGQCCPQPDCHSAPPVSGWHCWYQYGRGWELGHHRWCGGSPHWTGSAKKKAGGLFPCLFLWWLTSTYVGKSVQILEWNVQVHMRTHTHMHSCMHATHTHTRSHTHRRAHTHTHTYVRTHTHTHMCAHTHTHTHAQTHKGKKPNNPKSLPECQGLRQWWCRLGSLQGGLHGGWASAGSCWRRVAAGCTPRSRWQWHGLLAPVVGCPHLGFPFATEDEKKNV